MTAEAGPSPELVASSALAFYAALPKNGKPQPNEFTVFAAFLVSSGADCSLRVVAAGTGTKCLPGSKRSAQGSTVSDCHAEVLARRALLAWLYDEAQLAVQQTAAAAPPRPPAPGPAQGGQAQPPRGCSVLRFERSSGLLVLRPGVRLHMYVSQPPCGDASIITLAPAGGHAALAGGRDGGGPPGMSEDAAMQDAGGPGACCTAGAGVGATPAPPAAMVLCADGGLRLRTGAKALKLMQPPGGPVAAAAAAGAEATLGQQQQGQESMEEGPAALVQSAPSPCLVAASGGPPAAHKQSGPGGLTATVLLPTASDVEAGAQEVGLARRKPGKGAPTLSMSCSDKLSRWACLGLQGSLLGALMAGPLRLTSLTVGAPPGLAADAGPASIAGAQQAAQRAVFGRLAAILPQLPPPFGGPPDVLQTVAAVAPPPAAHGLAPSEQRTVGSGAGISWYAAPGCSLPHEDSGCSTLSLAGGSGLQGPRSESASVAQEGDAGGAQARSMWRGKAGAVPEVRPSMGTLQVLAAGEGSKAGLPKAARADPRHWPALCRAALLERFCLLLEAQAATLLAEQAAPQPEQADAAPLPPCVKILSGALAAGGVPSAPAGALVDGAEHRTDPPGATSDLEVGPALLALRSCTYAAVKGMCAQVGGCAAAWRLAQQPPSPLHCWIPKPDHLHSFTCKAFHEAHRK